MARNTKHVRDSNTRRQATRQWWLKQEAGGVGVYGFPYCYGSHLPKGIRVREVSGDYEFVRRVLTLAESLKKTRIKTRHRYGKRGSASVVHNAKLNVLQHVLAIFDKTIADISQIKEENYEASQG